MDGMDIMKFSGLDLAFVRRLQCFLFYTCSCEGFRASAVEE